MTKIDRRKTYYLTVDTETANGLDDALVYDLGYAIHDKYGNVYEANSLVIADIYCGERKMMKTAYYANKLPKYEVALKSGERKMVSLLTARKMIHDVCEKYNVKAIIAHALNRTLRYITKSKYRYFFPYGVEIYDSQKMAETTICKQKTYVRFCEENGYNRKNGKPRATAEILYRYISGEEDFVEEHQGLDDVLIEIAISAKCFAQHKPMRKLLFAR